RNQKKSNVNIGSDNVGLFRKIYGFSNDVVFPFINMPNHAYSFIAFFFNFKIYVIAHRYWVCTFNSANTEFAFYTTIVKNAIFRFHGIPTAGGFIYDSFHKTKLQNLLIIHYLFLMIDGFLMNGFV